MKSGFVRVPGGAYPKAVDNIDPPPWIKRIEDIFDEPQLYIDDATATDVHQGNSGDCMHMLFSTNTKTQTVTSNYSSSGIPGVKRNGMATGVHRF
ncbi:hypothetical protein BST61_g10362 [Cercospora zeina]